MRKQHPTTGVRCLKDPAKAILLIMPICISLVSVGLFAFQETRIQNANSLELKNPDLTAIAYLRFFIENRSAEDLFDFKVDLDYDVQVNSSHPTTLNMLVSGDRAAFGVPSGNMPKTGESFTTFTNGSIGEYQTSTFELTARNFPVTGSSGWAFPWDSLSSPVIYFWASPSVYSQLHVVSAPPMGFAWNLELIGQISREKLWGAMSLVDRLFLGLPPTEVPIFALRINLVRDTGPFLASEIYALAGVMVVWLAGGLTRTSIHNREQRIPAQIGMAIAALAFSWSFHQVAPPSPTLVESFVLGFATFWLALEASDALRERPRRIVTLDSYAGS